VGGGRRLAWHSGGETRPTQRKEKGERGGTGLWAGWPAGPARGDGPDVHWAGEREKEIRIQFRIDF
jgi:hypothetical protein